MRTPASAGPTVRAALTMGAVQRNGGGHQVSAHDLRNEGRSCRDLIRDEQAGLVGEESAAREPVPCPVGYG
jgi:hypothetical protein